MSVCSGMIRILKLIRVAISIYTFYIEILSECLEIKAVMRSPIVRACVRPPYLQHQSKKTWTSLLDFQGALKIELNPTAAETNVDLTSIMSVGATKLIMSDVVRPSARTHVETVEIPGRWHMLIDSCFTIYPRWTYECKSQRTRRMDAWTGARFCIFFFSASFEFIYCTQYLTIKYVLMRISTWTPFVC